MPATKHPKSAEFFVNPSGIRKPLQPGVRATHASRTHRDAQRAMTAPTGAWIHSPMTSMFIFTGGAVGVLLVSFIVAEVRDAARTRRFR
jgi:hypothetical protein